MAFERGHAAEHPLVHETREAPLERFFDFRAGVMHQPPDMVQDRFCKFSRFGNVTIHSWIFFPHKTYFAAVFSTLMCRNRATGQPWLTALDCDGSPFPSFAAPLSS